MRKSEVPRFRSGATSDLPLADGLVMFPPLIWNTITLLLPELECLQSFCRLQTAHGDFPLVQGRRNFGVD